LEAQKINGIYRIMMKDSLILAIESTGNNCGVAIGDTENVYFDMSLNVKHSHDKKLAVMIKQSISFLDLTIDDIAAVAISSGPGSFTGLRVGSAIAKGLTFDESPKLIAVPTLSSLSNNAKEYLELIGMTKIMALIPSNRDNYFMQLFDNNAYPTNEPELISKDKIEEMLSDDMLVCGPGSEDFDLTVNQLLGLNTLTPKNILKFAQIEFINNRFVKSEEFSPRYYQEFKPTQKKSK